MELSKEVSEGLGYLANGSYISEDNFKKIVNSSLGLLSGEQNIERVSNICPEKGDIIKQVYASLITFSIEIIRNKDEDEVQNIMTKHNFKTDRIDYFVKVLNLHRENIVKSLESCNSSWPSIVDVDWKLDYIVKTNMQSHGEGPLYYVVLTTEKNGKLDYVKFTCNLHQLQDFSTKLKEIVCHIEKISNDEAWNLWSTKSPPICSVKTELHVKKISELKEITFNALQTVRDLSVLDKEAAILSRFLYKNKRVFRHDKGMQNLVKVNQCLRRYLKLDLKGVLLTFKQSLPHKLSALATHAYLPTQQMLKWVLLKLQAFSQLFARVLRLTKQAGTYIYQKICLGWSLNLSLLLFAMTARFMVLSKFLIGKSIEWYSSFYKGLPFLKETADFLPGYAFPVDLKQWLGPMDLTPLKQKALIDNIFEIIDLAREGEDDEIPDVEIINEKFIESILKTNMKINSAADDDEIMLVEDEEEVKAVKRSLQSSMNEDLGVPVDGEEEIFAVPRKKMKKKKKKCKGF